MNSTFSFFFSVGTMQHPCVCSRVQICLRSLHKGPTLGALQSSSDVISCVAMLVEKKPKTAENGQR